MKFTDTNVTLVSDTSMVCVETALGAKGYATPSQIVNSVNVLTPDQVTLSDMTGIVIPANTLGQKAGVLHFGDSPAFDGKSRFRTTAANNTGEVLGSFVIPADLMVPESLLWLDLDLHYWTNSGGADPSDMAICVDFLTGATNDLTKGWIIPLTKDSKGHIKAKGYINLTEIDPGDLAIEGYSIENFGLSILKTGLVGGYNAVTAQMTGGTTSTLEGWAPVNTEATIRIRAVVYQGTHVHTGELNVSGECLLTA